jgi:hypothetical protein
MLKVSHTTLVVLSGLIWLGIGCFLLTMGLNFIIESILKENLSLIKRPVLDIFVKVLGNHDQGALALIALSLGIGFMKGRFVFSKTVQKSIRRILTLPQPAPLTSLYPASYLILLVVMGFLGYILRFAALDVRGAVDIAVGSALIQGAALYFKQAFFIRRMQSSHE